MNKPTSSPTDRQDGPGPVVSARGLTKVYPTAPPVTALCGVDIDVAAGERVVIAGRSGAGKSTLLNILGLLDTTSSGAYTLLGHNTTTISGRARDRLRAQVLGFVFQENHILGHRTVAENVDLKLSISRGAARLPWCAARPGAGTCRSGPPP